MKKNKLIIIFFLLLTTWFLLWLSVYSKNNPPNRYKKTGGARINNTCLITDEQAIAATEEFSNKIGLAFQDSPIVKGISRSDVDYPGIRNLKDVSYGPVRFYVGCESGVVENFDDFGSFEDNFPYSAKKEPSNCKKTIESLAKNIGIPSDMHFEKVENDWRKGVWVGKFVRIIDGYKYDLDNVAIGISDKSGKIALYRKIYFGQSCPTEIKIQKDEAIRMASTEFHKLISGRVRSHSDDLYERNERLLIVQPERPKWRAVRQTINPPLKEKSSRLAWVISYNFTGGIKPQKRSKLIEEMSPQERHDLDIERSEYEDLIKEYGNPVISFEMRIDSGNGEILYVAHDD